MKEIYDIPLHVYEDTKHTTPEEQTEFTRKEAQLLIDIFGLKVIHPEPSLQRRFG